jgi:menaquinone-specific isochorismate synthase
MITQQSQLDDYFKQAVEKARQIDQSVLFSYVQKIDEIDPIYIYEQTAHSFRGERFFWKNRNQTTEMVGAGSAFMIRSDEKKNRFKSVENTWNQVIEGAFVTGSKTIAGTGPLLFGGFSFDPMQETDREWLNFTHATFQVPSYLFTQNDEGTFATLNILCTPLTAVDQLRDMNDEMSNWINASEKQKNKVIQKAKLIRTEEIEVEQWKKSLEKAIMTLKTPELDKVVLARKLLAEFDRPIYSENVIRSLQEQQKESYIFSLEMMDHCFIGATPERLILKEGDHILSTCLAGSIARDNNVERDNQLGQDLLNDPKNLHEHQLVVDMIASSLNEHAIDVKVPEKPKLMKMKDIQHLYTPVTGTANTGSSILDFVELLHPTPALGGVPREKAMEHIRTLEQMDRGFYAGPIGWFDHNGNGEFAVAIRSGLLFQHHALLFAGCGVVKDSNVESEYEETKIKFRPMLRAIGGLNE